MGACIYGYFTSGSSAPARTRRLSQRPQPAPRRRVLAKAGPVPAPSKPSKPAA